MSVVRVLEDGTHVYSNGTKYRPKRPEERKRAIRKPSNPDAVLYQGDWYLPLDLLPEDDRVLPETRADSDAYDHMVKPRRCKCRVCKRPQARKWRMRWRRDQRQMGSDSASTMA